MAVFGVRFDFPILFLFAVARWGQRNLLATRMSQPLRFVASIRCRETGTAERASHADDVPHRISIRCREMGTAELKAELTLRGLTVALLFAVARWGQRNSSRRNRKTCSVQ